VDHKYLAIAVTCKVLHKCVVHPKMTSDSDWRAINDIDEDNNCIIKKRVVCTERNEDRGLKTRGVRKMPSRDRVIDLPNNIRSTSQPHRALRAVMSV